MITDKTLNISTTDPGLNKYAIQFWQEELVCSNEVLKTDSTFTLTANRCCRDIGKDITIGTYIDTTIVDFDNTNVPATQIDLSSTRRYSRLSTIHKDMTDTPADFPALSGALDNACGTACVNITTLTNQFNSFAQMAERTSCTGHWIRNFHDSNGGGHKWSPSKLQNVDKQNFRCINWSVDATFPLFSCSDTAEPDDPDCPARTVPQSQADNIFEWVGTMELLGISQVAVKSGDFTEVQCNVNPITQAAPAGTVIPGLIVNGNVREYVDGASELFSGRDLTNFNSDLKLSSFL